MAGKKHKKKSKTKSPGETNHQNSTAQGISLSLVLRNLDPLCLPMTGNPGNLIRTQSFIRGQTLRGALMAWAIDNNKVSDALTVFQYMSVGDALPMPYGEETAGPLLPMPLSILTDKPSGTDSDLPWWAAGSSPQSTHDGLNGRHEPKEKQKRPGAHEYIYHDATAGWLRYAPLISVRLRNATPRRNQYTDAELFSLEEISEQTCFQAELRFETEATMRLKLFKKTFGPLLVGDDWLAIGRGGAPFEVVSLSETTALEQRSTDAVPQPDDWTLTLTSDLILRGPHLGFLDDLDTTALCSLAGIHRDEELKVEERTTETDQKRILPSALVDNWVIAEHTAENERVYGFNAVSGLQRAPAVAIRRGSCWRITGPDSAMLAQTLAKISALGERTDEGFGRFLIDVQPINTLSKPQAETSISPSDPRGEQLLAHALELSGLVEDKGPSPSQLQWLRGRALAATKPEQITDLLAEIENAPSRRPQGGMGWKGFPVTEIREKLGEFTDLKDQRQLISNLVQWRMAKRQHALETKQ